MSYSAPRIDWVRIWLTFIALLIFAMVIVGGATRLTDSGLSITEWQPLLGAIPPLDQSHWIEAFEKYKLIPEYQIQNRGMTLEEFKFIYWWEWSHRFLGRFIGLAFIVPLVFFIATKRITRSQWPALLMLFVIGGLQGALGWYMVSSGLVDRVDVSQYRLAAHLSLAVLLYASVVYLALNINRPTSPVHWKGRNMSLVFIGLLFVQIAAGGFVAGLDAGHAAYDWPTMNGALLPDGLTTLQPPWRNWFENALAVQFNHRIIAYVLLAFAIVQALRVRNGSSYLVLAAVLFQASLGIATVMGEVQLHTALFHQGGALVVLALAIWHYSKVSRAPLPDPR